MPPTRQGQRPCLRGLGCREGLWAWCVMISPGTSREPGPGCAVGLPSHQSFLVAAAVVEGLQHLESKVLLLTILSGSQIYSGKAQDSQEKVCVSGNSYKKQGKY